eukprot:SAG31_NODE_43712_length_266_cov_0.598802_1_plen_56_part_10
MSVFYDFLHQLFCKSIHIIPSDPVASQNLKDFYNLVHVYLDAVFFPRAINDPTVLQ